MTDLGEGAVLRFRCPSCGLENSLTLAQVILSQDSEQACTCRGESECPPFYYADLFNRSDIDELLQVWRRLQEQAEGRGATLGVEG